MNRHKLVVGFLIYVGLWFAYRPFAIGFICWYVTGFDDLSIFSSNYREAVARGHGWKSIAGVLTAVTCMIAIVGFGGQTVGKALKDAESIAIFAPLVPFFYGLGVIEGQLKETWVKPFQIFCNLALFAILAAMWWVCHSIPADNILRFSWVIPLIFLVWRLFGLDFPEYTGKKAFIKSFLGFAFNCTDDISLNLTIAATVYVGAWEFTSYMSGIAVGALSMVTIAHLLMKRHIAAEGEGSPFHERPGFQLAGYWGASLIILLTMQFNNVALVRYLAGIS